MFNFFSGGQYITPYYNCILIISLFLKKSRKIS
nr:MAG TPA: hypothetical protein [Caudoviricetes sp.]